MKRKRYSAGEVRFRIGKQDLERLEWLLDREDTDNISALLRSLIRHEHDRLQQLEQLSDLFEKGK